jgi:hypothetical protein
MNNNNHKKSAIDRFLKTTEPTNVKDSKRVVLDEREGLIERVDKILITKDGKQLLREQY